MHQSDFPVQPHLPISLAVIVKHVQCVTTFYRGVWHIAVRVEGDWLGYDLAGEPSDDISLRQSFNYLLSVRSVQDSYFLRHCPLPVLATLERASSYIYVDMGRFLAFA